MEEHEVTPYRMKERMAKPVSVDIPLLYQDEHLLVVDKPAGVVVIPDRMGKGGLLRTLRKQLHLTDEDDLRVVHRIDRETTGALLVARSLVMQRALVTQFQLRKVSKMYLALVIGQPAADSGMVDQRIAKSAKAGMMKIDPAGKRAITRWRVKERFYGYCLLECRPVTGRTHQIRLHMQHIAMPLIVDPLYGGTEGLYLSQIKMSYKQSTRKQERPLLSRLPLHAASIRFTHPATGQEMTVQSPVPKDLATAIKQLEKYAPMKR